jgi:hypothetical protein
LASKLARQPAVRQIGDVNRSSDARVFQISLRKAGKLRLPLDQIEVRDLGEERIRKTQGPDPCAKVDDAASPRAVSGREGG